MLASVSGRPRALARIGGAFRIAAGADPDRQRAPAAGRGEISASSRGGRKRPCHVTRSAAFSCRSRLELFGEKRVVVGEVVAEEREQFDKGAAPGDELGAPAGE